MSPPLPSQSGRSSSSRPLPLRTREDLIAVPVERRHELAYVVKDPIAMTYTHLRADEYFVLCQLDGVKTLDQICDRYAERFAPLSLKPARLNELLFRFHEHGLLIASPVGQAQPLTRRAGKKQRQKVRQMLLSPLCIRFPGVDPDRWLTATMPWVRPLLHPISLFAYAILAVTSLLAFASHIDEFVAETSDMNRWFRFESILLLAGVIGGTKIMHELGHAYVCKHYGGECHTIGPMMLLFSPALYCDTSDAWLFRSRWQRAAVGAAGMGVEWVLASLATLIWLSTAPGLIHFAAMNVMLVCSISTLLFNANPLLRYDGYYILSDLCDVPNLAQRSQRLLSSTLTGWLFTGGEPSESVDQPAKAALLGYAALSWIYRWSLTFVILYLLSRMLRPIGLESLGMALCAFAAATALWSSARPLLEQVRNPMKRRKVQMRRLALTCVGAGLVVAALTYPLPARVSAVATLAPGQSQSVYVTVAGFLEMEVAPGEHVEQGQLLARLCNPAVELDYVTATGKLNDQRAFVDALQRAELRDPSVRERLPTALATIEDLIGQYQIHRSRKEALEIRAPRAGIVLPGESKPRSDDDEERLSEWTDFATDEQNRGCFVASGTELCRIASPDSFEAELLVPQSVATRVARDANVKLTLTAMPKRFHRGTVVDVSRRNMSTARGDIDATEAKSALTAGTTALDVTYLVRVRMTESAAHMLPGQQGDALVATAPLSLAHRVYLVMAGLLRMR